MDSHAYLGKLLGMGFLEDYERLGEQAMIDKEIKSLTAQERKAFRDLGIPQSSKEEMANRARNRFTVNLQRALDRKEKEKKKALKSPIKGTLAPRQKTPPSPQQRAKTISQETISSLAKQGIEQEQLKRGGPAPPPKKRLSPDEVARKKALLFEKEEAKRKERRRLEKEQIRREIAEEEADRDRILQASIDKDKFERLALQQQAEIDRKAAERLAKIQKLEEEEAMLLEQQKIAREKRYMEEQEDKKRRASAEQQAKQAKLLSKAPKTAPNLNSNTLRSGVIRSLPSSLTPEQVKDLLKKYPTKKEINSLIASLPKAITKDEVEDIFSQTTPMTKNTIAKEFAMLPEALTKAEVKELLVDIPTKTEIAAHYKAISDKVARAQTVASTTALLTPKGKKKPNLPQEFEQFAKMRGLTPYQVKVLLGSGM